MLWLLLPAGFVALLLIRAALFCPKKDHVQPGIETEIDETRIVENFAAMLQCRTVSYDDASMKEEAEFAKFRALLDERYPLVASVCEKHSIEPAGVVYHWKGKGGNKPWVLMSHYDVVPVEESLWDEKPFDAVIKNGEIWGRGAVDTKCTLLGVMEGAEALLKQGFQPQNDIYFAFGGDEELFGESATEIVKWFESQGISPSVLDEGGAIVGGVFPGVSKQAAVIGTGEKGITNIRFSLESKGGHASTPPPHTPVGVIAKAITKIESHPFSPTIEPPVAELFNTLGRHASFGMKIIFANLWCFKPLLFLLARIRGGELNAMLRTTCAVTRIQGSDAWNVIPPKAWAGANLRLLNHTPEEAVNMLKSTINNDDILLTVVTGTPPSPYSQAEGESWDMLKETILQTWPEVIVSPYLMMAASDSRHYARISDRVYRFSPMEMPLELRKTIHGHNERIPIETLLKTVRFYMKFIDKI